MSTMSLLPYLMSRYPSDPFKLRNDSHTLLADLLPFMSGDSIQFIPGQRSAVSIKEEKKFQVNLDVHHFAPDEINVKVVDGFVVITAKHGEKRDIHGWVSREFTRRYPLPEGCDPESVMSRLSSDGVLTIIGLHHEPVAGERIVPITQTGPIKTHSAQVIVPEQYRDFGQSMTIKE